MFLSVTKFKNNYILKFSKGKMEVIPYNNHVNMLLECILCKENFLRVQWDKAINKLVFNFVLYV